jgi:1,2-diacylglycerol 3-alpha-glucosyltransferase
LKIGMFTDTWEPQINGVVTSLRGLTSALRDLNHEVTIIAPQIPGQHAESGLLRIRSVPYRPQPEHRMALPPGPRKLLQLKALDLDLIHTHGIFLPTMALGVARAFNLPLVHTYHTRMRDYVHHYPGYPTLAWLTDERRWYARYSRSRRRISRSLRGGLDRGAIAFAGRFDVWYANHCQAIITPAHPMAGELQRMGVKTPIEVVSNGIDLENLLSPQSDPFPAFGVPDGVIRLLTVSRLDREKSVDELLRRFARIHTGMPNTHLTVVGDGPKREELEALSTKLGIRDSVVFTGYVPSREVGGFYQHAHLFVFASVSETQGLVALEAAACGLPVVARAEMGVTTCVLDGQTGFLVDPNDPQAFADRTVELLQNRSLRLGFSKAASVWAQREVGLARMADQAVEVYHRALQAFSGWNDYNLPGNVATELEMER